MGCILTHAAILATKDPQKKLIIFIENIYCDLKTAYSQNNRGWWDLKQESLIPVIYSGFQELAKEESLVKPHYPPNFFKRKAAVLPGVENKNKAIRNEYSCDVSQVC
ncbi:hypothetical protein [Legionella sp. km772]|uniref:hypothetical protein n=1 Tax=Legionella sp. km772 TaxID=2498111 RepID=UPI000F8DB0F3|nr:hypothetical protein [Legionella sp. km772]RUR13289.1 hypothetical protein ELY15_02845 [Legionella sp. km772]